MTGKQIKQRREKTNMSREDLASKIGVSFQTIYRWEEKGVQPHKTFLKKINELLIK